MNYDPIPICLYFGGKIITDSTGYGYDGPRPYIIHENPKIRFDELKRKIYSVTNWSEITDDLEINCRWQAGRGGRLFFVLVPITNDESLTSVIRNTQSGKLDWSLVELYIEKKSKEVGCSGNAEEVVNIEIEDIRNVEIQDNILDEPEDVMIGEVGRIVADEWNSFDEARINNNLDDHDDGEEAFPLNDDEEEEEEEDEEEENIEIMKNLEGIQHFGRSAPEYFVNMELASSDVRGDMHGVNQDREDFYVGQVFQSRDHLKDAVKEWSIVRHRDFVTHKSGPTVYTLKCKQAHICPWRLHASLSKRDGTFKIKSLVGPHICVNQNITRDHRLLSSQFISKYIFGLIKKQLGTTPAGIVETMKIKFGYNISYAKAWRAKSKALKHLFGGWREAYSMLPRLIGAMKLTNPKTVYKKWSDPTNLDGIRVLRGFFFFFWHLVP